MPLFVSSALFAEEKKYGSTKSVLLQLAVVVPLAIGFYFVVPFALLRTKQQAWWNYAVSFFSRLLLTIIYTGILFLGIVLILEVRNRHLQGNRYA